MNVQKVDHAADVRSVHRPAMSICSSPVWHVSGKLPFLIHHYLGSWESYSYRDDARKGLDRTYDSWLHRSNAASVIYNAGASTWINGFQRSVGLEKANRLLSEAGLPADYDASAKIVEFRCKLGNQKCNQLKGDGGMAGGMMMGGAPKARGRPSVATTVVTQGAANFIRDSKKKTRGGVVWVKRKSAAWQGMLMISRKQ